MKSFLRNTNKYLNMFCTREILKETFREKKNQINRIYAQLSVERNLFKQ